jgi:hypothetical protein
MGSSSCFIVHTALKYLFLSSLHIWFNWILTLPVLFSSLSILYEVSSTSYYLHMYPSHSYLFSLFLFLLFLLSSCIQSSQLLFQCVGTLSKLSSPLLLDKLNFGSNSLCPFYYIFFLCLASTLSGPWIWMEGFDNYQTLPSIPF